MKHHEDIIRVKFKEHFDEPFYTHEKTLYFDNFESVKNWMIVKFREFQIYSIEIDIVEVQSCEDYYGC